MASLGDAFLCLVGPHTVRLGLVARRYATDPAAAADLVQETLLRAWRRFRASPADAFERAWLFVILRNVAAEWHRTRRRRIRLVPLGEMDLTDIAATDASEPLAVLPPMNEQQFREFLDDRVAGALDALDAPFREVLILSVAGGLNYREIAEVLDCPVGTVMSRMGRARRGLRERLAEYARATGWVTEKRA